tara:strand:- start:2399 stop:3526 length:1128 start_codon:yes stop_codon:yes gene_type:complete
MKYPLNKPFINKLELSYASDAIKTGWLSVNGKYNKLFEKEFKKFVNKRYVLGVQSGTAALHLALKSIKTKSSHKIITPSFSCSSNISSISQCGATAIIIDVENDTFGLDYNEVKKAIKKHKIYALQLVHVYGHPARDTKKILRLCKKNKIFVIEDGSESLGAKIEKKKIGSFGDISIFSLRSEKMIGVGEGGMICTNSKKIFYEISLLASRNMPFRDKKSPYWKKYISLGEGYNYLLPHIPAALGYAQMKKINTIINNKKKVGKLYTSVFKEMNSQKTFKNSTPVYWLNSLIFKKLNKTRIRQLGDYLKKFGIEVRSGFWPLSKTPKVKKIIFNKDNFSNNLFEKLIVLPSNYSLTKKDILFFKDKINQFLNKVS